MRKQLTAKNLIAALALIGATSLFAAPAIAADEAAVAALTAEERAAEFEARFDEMAERLELTDEQRAQVEPIIRESIEKSQAVMAEAGIVPGEKATRGQLLSIRGEMSAIRKSTTQQLAEILTDEQMEEFKVIREENRAEMMARLQGRAS